jgi:hypothetical protein
VISAAMILLFSVDDGAAILSLFDHRGNGIEDGEGNELYQFA